MKPFDLHGFTRLVVSRARLFYIVAVVFGVFGAIISVTLRPMYEARVVVFPASLLDLHGKNGALGGLANLVDLAGIGSGSNDDVEKSIATLTSRRFTADFLREEGILPVIYSERWDSASKSWRRVNKGAVSRVVQSLRRLIRAWNGDEAPIDDAVASDANLAPSEWQAFKKFDEMRVVSRDRKTGLITISIKWRNPTLAAKWANDLVDRVNDELRNVAIRESEERLAYLRNQLEDVQTSGLREALVNVTVLEQRKAMLAHVQKAYAFEVIDPAVTPGERASPHRIALVFASVLFGLFAALVFLLYRFSRSQAA